MMKFLMHRTLVSPKDGDLNTPMGSRKRGVATIVSYL